mgnify:FL=1
MKFLFFIFFISSYAYSQFNLIDENGLKQGDWVLFYPYNQSDSIVSEKGVFVDDLEDGLWIKYHKNGKIREIVNYLKGDLHGLRLLITKHGKLKEQENFINGKYDGLQMYFHDNGKPSTTITYLNGVKDGPLIK